MRDTDKQDYIAQAERHISIVQERIARQKMIIDELAQKAGNRLRYLNASCSGELLAGL